MAYSSKNQRCKNSDFNPFMQQLTRLLGGGVIFLLFVMQGQAQRPGEVFGGITPQAQPQREQRNERVIPDTVGIFFLLADNPNREKPFSDSTLANFQQYDPVRKRELDYMHLGNPGSAHQPLVFETTWRRGFEVGLNQFDLYMTKAPDVKFYRLQKAYSNFAFMVGSEQAETYLQADFSRNFANRLNFAVSYDRLSWLGTENQFPNQNVRNTTVTLGFWLRGKTDRYQGFLAATTNTIEHEDHGGIEAEIDLTENNATPAAAQVFLDNAQSRYANQEVAYTHYLQLGGKPDSLKGMTRAFTLSHQAVFGNYIYKFFDDNVNADATFFQRFPNFNADLRGVRHFIQHQKIENSFRLRTFKLGQSRVSEAKRERDLLEVGVVSSIYLLNQEPRDTTINNLFLTGKWNISLGERLRLETYGHLGLLDNVGDYRAEGRLLLDFKNFGRLEGEFVNQLYSPNLLQHRFFVSQRPIWNNDFRQTLETSIGGTYSLSNWDLRITGRYHLLNNYIYFDTLSTPKQTSVPISILQFILQKDFKVWNFHLDNTVALQQASEDFVRLPQIFAKHSFYYQGYWFQVLNVRVGFDVRYNSTYFADYYNPVTGQFHLQDSREVPLYPGLDAFFTMRVTKFRAFAKFENMLNSASFRSDEFFYQTAYYAHPPAALRVGFKWRLVD